MEDSTNLISLCLSLSSPFDDDIIMEAASVLDEEAVSSSWEKVTVNGKDTGWTIMWVIHELPDIKALSKRLTKIIGINITEDLLAWQPVPDVNWLEESYRSFPPLRVGSFYIFGSHHKDPIPKGVIPLQIDAATAFGSGEHGTTRGCLEALVKLHKAGFKPKTILDMGSGSGILAIAAWKLWKKPILAVDIDKEATAVACRHRRINGVPTGEKGMRCVTGDGYRARAVRQNSKEFDLIIANILAAPLVHMAPDLSSHLSKKGKAVLSGLLIEQQDDVIKAHQACGLKRPSRLPRGEWQTLIMGL